MFDKISKMFPLIEKEKEIPENTIYLEPNFSKNKEKITSYSIFIYEPDYPLTANSFKNISRNCVVLNIKPKDNLLELMIEKQRFSKISVPSGAVVKELKSDEIYMHVLVDKESNELEKYIRENIEYCIDHYVSKADMFGCCSLFEQCFDAKKCLHINRLYSKSCLYRENLEDGRIFYGKNKTI